MKFDLTKFPVSDDETQLKDEKGKLADYKVVFIKALSSDIDYMGKPIMGEDKYKRCDLYIRFKRANGTIELDNEDIDLLKDAVLVFPIVVASQAQEFLTGNE